MFIAISPETKMILQKSQNSLITIYRNMEKAGITEIEEAGRTIEKHEILKGAVIIDRILDVCV